jgi:hypothetical protein
MIKPPWTLAQINLAKRSVKEDLDAVQATDGEEARRDRIISKISELEPSHKPSDQLTRLIYLISFLVHHERHGGLSSLKIRKITELAESIIAVNGITKGNSTFSFLYGEIHLVLSQIHRKAGDHWQAAWEQRLVHYTARKNVPGGTHFQALSSGIRNLRMGNAQLALQYFEKSEEGLKGVLFEKARLGRIKTLRICARLEDSEALANDTSDNIDLSLPGIRELEWEFICQEFLATGDLTPLVKVTKKGGSHSGSVFAMEAALWFRSVEKRDWLNRGIKTRSLIRRKSDKPDTSSQFYKACSALENTYDSKIPLPIRLEKLGRVLSTNNLLLTVDKELLVWASAARCLARVSAFSLASLALHEYVSISRRLSDGRCDDALGTCSDMVARSWFSEIL